MTDLELLSVALMRDIVGTGLVRGQVGTVVEVLGPDVFEVDSAMTPAGPMPH
jgi:hypothetical protein